MGLFRSAAVEHNDDRSERLEGLSSKEARKRLSLNGFNELAQKKRNSMVMILFAQFNDFMIWVLMGAAVISAMMGETADAVTILAIIVLNAILGFIQEFRTERSLEALAKLASPTAKVVRDSVVRMIGAREVVIGDVILLEEGDKIPADAALINSEGLACDESILTGESQPVEKGLAAGRNRVFMGTMSIRGRAYARVIATGMDTEMGKIAFMLQDINTGRTPLQIRLEKLGRILVAGCLLVCLVVTVAGILRGEDVYQMFLIGVSLAVAAIPEGLPAIVTVSLALGIQRMMKKNTLVRKLPAVETLGCTSVICSDKTGTLTQNRMTVKSICLPAAKDFYEITGDGYTLSGRLLKGGRNVEVPQQLNKLLYAAVLCNNAALPAVDFEVARKNVQSKGEKDQQSKNTYTGDPTETALLVMAFKLNVKREILLASHRIISEKPFDSTRKMMSVRCLHKGIQTVYVKGAMESVLKACSHVMHEGNRLPLDAAMVMTIEAANARMARAALRVLCFASKEIDTAAVDFAENGLTFLGMVGMIDPPRSEVKDAILECRIAGIRPVMITGDHKLTAEAIAEQLHLLDKGSMVVTGQQLDEMSENNLRSCIDKIRVFARVSPAHKLRIVKAFKQTGAVVAMTGDGVNDAPAVKEADIGIAMGMAGTDVTKEASSMILLDDNFATIVAAVREGRAIYDNIRKFIRYLLACNIGEVLVMLLATLLNMPIPLLPIQILLVNLATDGLPAMALAMEPAEPDVMSRKPRPRGESIFSDGLWTKILLRGILIGVCTVVSYSMTLSMFGGSLQLARTVALCTLVMSQLFHVFECRSERNLVFRIGVFSNHYLVMAVASSLAMLLCVVYLPFLQSVFHTTGLEFLQWVIVLSFSGIISLISNLYWFKQK